MGGEGRLRRQLGVGLAYARLKLDEFDVIHAHGDDWLFGRRPRVRTFYGSALMEARTAHSLLRMASQLCYYGLEFVSSVGSQGVTISRQTRRYLPFARECIPCAFDPTVFFPGDERTLEPSILFVAGSLMGRKRGDVLLRAFAHVRRTLPNTQLTIVSGDTVLEPGITCLSKVSPTALGDLYRRHWILCSTSSYEGFGVPYVEALASGLPVVTTQNHGAMEVLEGGRLGVICSPDDIGTTLVRVLRDEAKRRQLAVLGLEASSRYSLEVVLDAYERLYEQVCHAAASRRSDEWPVS